MGQKVNPHAIRVGAIRDWIINESENYKKSTSEKKETKTEKTD